MSIRIMSHVWDKGPAKQADRFVMLALADFANDAGECWPSVGGIAKKCCMTDRGVRQILRRLECEGWINTDVGGGRHGCSKYTLNPEPRSPRNSIPPGTSAQKTRNETAQNPEPRSPEPSLTINEPSLDAPKRKRAVSLPPEWVPSERNIQDAISRNFTAEEIEHEADRFRDYHLAKGTTFKDWDAGWRTWLSNARKFSARNTGRGGGHDVMFDAFSRNAARYG